MELDLHVPYKGAILNFPVRLLLLGYIYKIEAVVNGIPVLFERDEERQWRALIDPDSTSERLRPEAGLIEAIIEELDKDKN